MTLCSFTLFSFPGGVECEAINDLTTIGSPLEGAFWDSTVIDRRALGLCWEAETEQKRGEAKPLNSASDIITNQRKQP